MPFDRVVIKREGRQVSMSMQDFLGIPMAERVTIILERSVLFYLDRQLVDRSHALKHLRTLSLPGA
jgi:hypothetical protein